jgi:hypothetical protein
VNGNIGKLYELRVLRRLTRFHVPRRRIFNVFVSVDTSGSGVCFNLSVKIGSPTW